MITSDAARQPVLCDCLEKQGKYGKGFVVVVGADGGYEARFAVDEAVDDDLEAYQAWNKQR